MGKKRNKGKNIKKDQEKQVDKPVSEADPFELAFMQRRAGSGTNEVQNPMVRRLDDWIPDLSEDDIKEALIEEVGNEKPMKKEQEEAREEIFLPAPPNPTFKNKIQKYRERLGKADKEVAQEPSFVKKIKQDNKPSDLLERFSKKLSGG